MPNSAARKPKIQPDWWQKTIAGAVLGFSLALCLSGLFAWLGPGGLSAENKTQFVMWSIAPIWMLLFATVYLFQTGNRALLSYGTANLLAYSALFFIKHNF
ncbi:hypothetical protein [Teredinibacter turnerae]|uniref:hypothetical protein n=1 Tax=Teredinibacter turnerae TaxID=2426 RepID=UPI000378CD3A|nr:hypothetical protein [Teredinibacter turnerae]